jgi:hypothetical protein
VSLIYTYPDVRIIMSRTSSQRRSNITKEDLCQLLGINAETAAQTLRVTTQKGIRNAVHPMVPDMEDFTQIPSLPTNDPQEVT